MSTVGVKELKNCLTQYLRRTKQGEEVIVTERGNPIALIQPIKSAEKAVSLEARLDLRRRFCGLAKPKTSEASSISEGFRQTDLKGHCERSPVIYLDTSALIKR